MNDDATVSLLESFGEIMDPSFLIRYTFYQSWL